MINCIFVFGEYCGGDCGGGGVGGGGGSDGDDFGWSLLACKRFYCSLAFRCHTSSFRIADNTNFIIATTKPSLPSPPPTSYSLYVSASVVADAVVLVAVAVAVLRSWPHFQVLLVI